MAMTPLLLRGGQVFDGTGRQPSITDILVVGDRIANTDGSPLHDTAVYDARGMWILPGFVDIHSHADLSVLSGDGMAVRHSAGVSTEVVGQDGLGLAPLTRATRDLLPFLVSALAGEGSNLTWEGMGEYLSLCSKHGWSRVHSLASHGTIRMAVMGMEHRAASRREIEKMRLLARRAAEEGARGLSSGLSYPPSRAATTEELMAVYEPFAELGLPYVTHLRDYGRGFGRALDEAERVAAQGSGRLHLSHFHVSGPGRAGEARRYLDRLDEMQGAGLTVTLDSYPYTAGCTFLRSFLPDWAITTPRGLERALTRSREKIAGELDRSGPGPSSAVGWTGFVLAGLEGGTWDAENGSTLVEAATRRGMSPGQAVVELCIEYPHGSAVLIEQGHLENIVEIASFPGHMVGSDGVMGSGMPHPRVAGAFLRFLRWARDGIVGVSVAEMVRRMTSAPAQLIAASDVGVIETNALADVCVIDPGRITDGPDRGAFESDAVRLLLIGGEVVRRAT